MTKHDGLPRLLVRLTSLLAAVLFWTLVIPGTVAYVEGVFYEVHLPADAAEPAKQLDRYNAQKKALEDIRDELDARLADVGRGVTIEDPERLLFARDHVVRELTELRPPVNLLPFYGNPSWCFWASAYAGLGILGLLLIKVPAPAFTARSVCAALAAYVSFSSTAWARNFAFRSRGRTIFSYVNYDIGPWSFVFQEARALGMCVLLALVCRAWSRHYARVLQEIDSWGHDGQTLVEVAAHASRIRGLFRNWQLASACVVVAFLPWTYFYWQTASVFQDTRYYVSAIVMHALWAITWITISAPLLAAMAWWINTRGLIVAKGCGDEGTLRALKEIDPISHAAAAGAALASVVSYLLPLLEFVRK
jgi:hypothetical protein